MREMTDAIDELHRLWDDALFDAVDAYQRTDAHDSTTDSVKYHLRSYSQKEKDNWANSKRIVLYENEEQYREFIQTSLSDKGYDKKMYFGAIPNDFAQFIQSKTGLNVENFNCTLASNEIRKIIKSHGNEAVENKRGQRAVTEDDFVNIPTVIQDSDDITLSPNLYNDKPVINFVKNLNGRITVSAVISDKHLDLYIQTAFVNIKKGNLATPTGEQAPINTPEASRGTVSNNRISEKNEYVNINDKKTEKKQIREAIPTVDELGINKKLKAQNKKLRGDVRELRELLRLQKEVTHGKKFKKSSIEAAASVLMKRFELTRGKESMAQQLEKFYEFIATSEQLAWADIEAEAMGIVDYVNGEKQEKAKRDSYAQDVLNTIRSTKIELSDMQRKY